MPQFISQSAIGSIAAHAATGVFSLVYIVLAQRFGMAISVAGAVGGLVRGGVPAARGASGRSSAVAAANLATYAVCIALTARYRHVKMPLIAPPLVRRAAARADGGLPGRRGGRD